MRAIGWISLGLTVIAVLVYLWGPGRVGPPAEGGRPDVKVWEDPPPLDGTAPEALQREVPDEVGGARPTESRQPSIVLLRADGSPAVDVPFRSWSGKPPGWVTGRGEHEAPPPALEPEGRTDGEGGFDPPEDAVAVSFLPVPGHVLSYTVEEGATELALPELAELRVELAGAPPGEHWRVRVGAEEEGELKGHAVSAVATGQGSSVLSLRYQERLQAADRTCVLTGVAGLPYAVRAFGMGFRLTPGSPQVRVPPAGVTYEFVARGPLVLVRVVERPDGPLVETDGRMVWRLPDSGWSSHYRLEKGRGFVTPGRSARELHELHVLLEDGEYFSREVQLAENELRRTLELVRGKGLSPRRVSFPGGVPDDVFRIVLQRASGELEYTDRMENQAFIPGFGDGTWFFRRGELYLHHLPDDWQRFFVFTRKGRVAEVLPAPALVASWLPDGPMQELDLAAVHRAHGRQPGQGICFLELQLTGGGGQRKWFTADAFAFDRDDPPPVWKKIVPLSLPYRFVFFAKARWHYPENAPDRVELPVRRR